jgi:hypothetical protein
MHTKLMRTVIYAGVAVLAAAPARSQEPAPKHEIGLTLGGLFGTDRQGLPARFDLGSGTALQANYGYRFLEGEKAALYGEVQFLANPQRLVGSSDRTLTRDVASIFVTPGIRVKFLQRAAFSPYVAVGGGYAVFEQSLTRLDGQPNPAPRTIHRGAVAFGGGADLKFWRFVGLRFEIRDFYSGNPAYNAAVSGGQHNVVAGGGIVLKLR